MIKTVVFDWKRTLYDPDNKVLIDGAIGVLDYLLEMKIPMILIGKGGDDMKEEVLRLGVLPYFKEIFFQEGKKDIEQFRKFITENPHETVFIGDRVKSELKIGNQLHAYTIWVKQGKFASEEPEEADEIPKLVISSLFECVVEMHKLNMSSIDKVV